MNNIASGLLRNPNLDLHHQELKLGLEGSKQEPWGHNIRGETYLEGPRPDWWWTGKRPEQCPGLLPSGALTSLPQPCLHKGAFTRETVLDYFDNTWTLTEVLLSALQTEEAFYRPPYHQLRHPMVFYYVHTAVLYVNKLRLAGLVNEPINSTFEQLFETGVDEMSWDDMSKNYESWPMIKECNEYRRQVYQLVRGLIETHPQLSGAEAVTLEAPLYALFMGFEHERIHFETSSVLMRELPTSLLRRPECWPPLAPAPPNPPAGAPVEGTDFPANPFVLVPAATVEVGRGAAVDSFGWDNEFGSLRLAVPPFEAQKCLCSNGQYWEFVRSRGYVDEANWSAEGWAWRKFRNAKWPTFWVPSGPQGLHEFQLRTLFEIVPMPWAWPAVVNRHEAQAYCAWLAKVAQRPCRLVTEAEHRLMRPPEARDLTLPPTARDPVLRFSGEAMSSHATLNLAHGSEAAVDAVPPSPAGVHDAMGNVWVWCEDQFCPLEGFRVHPLYDDFSTPCFDGHHFVIMGGSFISTGNLASIHARYHFRPHFFQHAGFRVVVGEGSVTAPPSFTTDQQGRRATDAASRVVAGQRAVHQALHLHYGGADPLAPLGTAAYPQRLARWVADVCGRHQVPLRAALDLGCSVGGVAFHLAQNFRAVTAIDVDARAVGVGLELKDGGAVPYPLVEEGRLTLACVARAPPQHRDRVTFLTADATCLPPNLPPHSVVLMAHLLDQACSPKAILARMGGLKGAVDVGGLLVTVTSGAWDEATTNEGAWLGGHEAAGQPVSTVEGLRAALGPQFEQVEEGAVPMAVRHTARQFVYTVGHAVAWRRLQ